MYHNWSQRNEPTEKDEGKKNRVDGDGRCCFSSAGAGCLRWFVALILSPPKPLDIIFLSFPTLLQQLTFPVYNSAAIARLCMSLIIQKSRQESLTKSNKDLKRNEQRE